MTQQSVTLDALVEDLGSILSMEAHNHLKLQLQGT